MVATFVITYKRMKLHGKEKEKKKKLKLKSSKMKIHLD